MDELFVDLALTQDVVAAADPVSRELFGRWSVSWQTGQGMVSCPVRDLAWAAAEAGWRYAVVTGWQPQALAGVEALPAQRRPLDDPFCLQRQLLVKAAAGPLRLSELAAVTSLPAAGRAHLLHLLWHRQLEIDLQVPLADTTIVRLVSDARAMP